MLTIDKPKYKALVQAYNNCCESPSYPGDSYANLILVVKSIIDAVAREHKAAAKQLRNSKEEEFTIRLSASKMSSKASVIKAREKMHSLLNRLLTSQNTAVDKVTLAFDYGRYDVKYKITPQQLLSLLFEGIYTQYPPKLLNAKLRVTGMTPNTMDVLKEVLLRQKDLTNVRSQ